MSRKGRQRRSRKPVPIAAEAPPASTSRPTSRPPAVAWLTPFEAETKSVSISSRPRSGEADGTPAEGGVVKRDGTSTEGGMVKSENVPSSSRPSPASPESGPYEDEASYPAVDVDTRFFESGRLPFESTHPDFDERDPRQSLRLTPTVIRRRAQFARYVQGAVGLSLALCAAALVKGAIARARPAGDASRAPVTSLADLPAAESAPAAPQESPAAPEPAKAANPAGRASVAGETVAAEEAVAPPPVVAAAPQEVKEPQAVAVPQAVAAPQAVAVVPQAVAAPQTATVSQAVKAPPVVAAPQAKAPQAITEKNAAQAALERGKIAASIAAGERSVAVDPTDGEAWLILGAAYQAQGNATEAHRCYSACIQKGNRGPRRECAAMLR